MIASILVIKVIKDIFVLLTVQSENVLIFIQSSPSIPPARMTDDGNPSAVDSVKENRANRNECNAKQKKGV
jgi:hypothetical protein